MQAIEDLFDNRIGRAITSMGAVTFVLLLYITGMIACSHTQFLRVFPDSMAPWEKDLAAWTISLAWELTVLNTISNPKHVDKRISWLIALASGVIMLFFIEAFDRSITGLQMAQRWFVAILTAAIGYIYAHLFYSKWADRMNLQQAPEQIDQLRAQAQQDAAALLQAAAETQQARAASEQLRAEVKDLHAEIKQLTLFKTRVEKELTCPHCDVLQPSYGTLRSHQGYCRKAKAA